MKAVILAAGEGTRLQPLTENVCKPMLPIAGRPLLEHLLELLRSHGVRDVAINLYYKPESIVDRFGDGSSLGLNISYSEEEQLLGTAGALKRLAAFLDETFVVLCGDVYTNADLTSLAEFHRWRDSIATMALCRVDDPGRAGLVEVAPNGRINRFEEKPPPERQFTDLACAGIYVFEPSVLAEIPDEAPCDLGHDLFPRLIERGMPVFGLHGIGEVLDIGSPERYAAAQLAAAAVAEEEPPEERRPIPIRRSGTKRRVAGRRGKQPSAPLIEEFLAESQRVIQTLDTAALEGAATLLAETQARGNAAYVIGNGGSSATASHLASDITRGTQKTAAVPLRTFSLTDNVPLFSAWANDVSYEESFAGQIRAFAQPGDALIAISASGNSPNIIRAAQAAREQGVKIIALAGFGGGRLAAIADVAIVADSDDYGQVEGVHSILAHLIAKAVIAKVATRAAEDTEASSRQAAS